MGRGKEVGRVAKRWGQKEEGRLILRKKQGKKRHEAWPMEEEAEREARRRLRETQEEEAGKGREKLTGGKETRRRVKEKGKEDEAVKAARRGKKGKKKRQ